MENIVNKKMEKKFIEMKIKNNIILFLFLDINIGRGARVFLSSLKSLLKI